MNVEQDISGIVEQLPSMPSDIPCFLVRRQNQQSPNGYKDFVVKRADIIAWLRFLHKYNRYYQDIDIDATIQRCNQILPENDSIASLLNSIDEVEFEEAMQHESTAQQNSQQNEASNPPDNNDNEDLVFDDEGDGIVRPETGGASGEENPPPVTNEYINLPINPSNQEHEQHERMLMQFRRNSIRQNTPVEEGRTELDWPTEGRILNDISEPGIVSRAFPTLFPYAAGDPTNKDRAYEVKMSMAARHFLKYSINMKDAKEWLLSTHLTVEEETIANSLWTEGENEFYYPYVDSDRFVHWMQNTCERHRAIGQRSFWLTKHSDYANMTEEELSGIINRGGEEYANLLRSMQSYNANIMYAELTIFLCGDNIQLISFA